MQEKWVFTLQYIRWVYITDASFFIKFYIKCEKINRAHDNGRNICVSVLRRDDSRQFNIVFLKRHMRNGKKKSVIKFFPILTPLHQYFQWIFLLNHTNGLSLSDIWERLNYASVAALRSRESSDARHTLPQSFSRNLCDAALLNQADAFDMF